MEKRAKYPLLRTMRALLRGTWGRGGGLASLPVSIAVAFKGMGSGRPSPPERPIPFIINEPEDRAVCVYLKRSPNVPEVIEFLGYANTHQVVQIPDIKMSSLLD